MVFLPRCSFNAAGIACTQVVRSLFDFCVASVLDCFLWTLLLPFVFRESGLYFVWKEKPALDRAREECVMRVLLQRVTRADVKVAGEEVGRIGSGLLALVGIGPEDDEADLALLARKVVHLRIFEDEDGKMNRSVLDVGGGILAVSQFTLYGDCRKGRRPSFVGARAPEEATLLFDRFVALLRGHDVVVEEGQFGAMMEVSLCNDGPVTIWLESRAGTLV